ncbi:unnamed protein product [Gadus morhua 'NCC']
MGTPASSCLRAPPGVVLQHFIYFRRESGASLRRATVDGSFISAATTHILRRCHGPSDRPLNTVLQAGGVHHREVDALKESVGGTGADRGNSSPVTGQWVGLGLQMAAPLDSAPEVRPRGAEQQIQTNSMQIAPQRPPLTIMVLLISPGIIFTLLLPLLCLPLTTFHKEMPGTLGL